MYRRICNPVLAISLVTTLVLAGIATAKGEDYAPALWFGAVALASTCVMDIYFWYRHRRKGKEV